MTLFSFFRRPRQVHSADMAKERLQILLAHERSDRSSGPDYLPLLQKEILEVIKKYVQIDSEKVGVKLERGAEMSTLEVNIELPAAQAAKRNQAAQPARHAFAR
ncbi:cell division topological specificity factor MinE [Rhodospirillaceae bacterium SYSU D60014]|uniref:cell division topological specificity factor MinE n=1 Tax=Virgifigura deserti TaxID=2268457 RepID=UPI000E66E887